MTIEPYNYNDEPSGRTDTLTQALEKIERLEKQLEIAIKCLKNYKSGTTDKWFAEVTLEQIKDLEK